MSGGVQYELIAMADREESAKTMAILKNKYKAPVGKKVTLNERFGVIEKGFILHAINPKSMESEPPVHLVIHERLLTSKREFVKKYVAAHPNAAKSAAELNENDKENGAGLQNAEKTSSTTSSEFCADAYIRDVARQILKPVA